MHSIKEIFLLTGEDNLSNMRATIAWVLISVFKKVQEGSSILESKQNNSMYMDVYIYMQFCIDFWASEK